MSSLGSCFSWCLNELTRRTILTRGPHNPGWTYIYGAHYYPQQCTPIQNEANTSTIWSLFWARGCRAGGNIGLYEFRIVCLKSFRSDRATNSQLRTDMGLSFGGGGGALGNIGEHWGTPGSIDESQMTNPLGRPSL